jgi:hypothetical protein
MVKLSELRKYDKEAYNLFMREVKRSDCNAWWKDCVMRDTHMAGAIVFTGTTQGSDYWWEVISRIENKKVNNSEKV